jgi:DnaJ family protein C protein 19
MQLHEIVFAGRAIVKYAPSIAKEVELKLASLPKSTSAFSDAKYYKGGFEAKMNRREAALILGVR